MKNIRLTGLLASLCAGISLCGCSFSEQPPQEATVLDAEDQAYAELVDEEIAEPITDSNAPVSANTEQSALASAAGSSDMAGSDASDQAASQGSNDAAAESSSTVTVGGAGAEPPVNTTYISESLQELQSVQYSEEQMAQIREFYNGAVFAGDSVLLGFRNYSNKSSDPMLKQLQFLAAGSLSLHNSFWPVSSKSVHPLYQGEQHPVWESMQMMGANKAFLFFGINDVSSNMEESISLYPQLVDKIREYSPGMDITIISATYTLKDMGKGKLNNTNIAIFNSAVKELAAQNGWGYIDIADVLSDGEGNLAPQYCSDGFLHESRKAYDIWTLALIRYAADRLGIQGTPVAAASEATS